MTDERTYKTFVFVADGDIFHTFKVEDSETMQHMIAGMQSQPLVLDVTGREYIAEQYGWKYGENGFYQDNILEQEPVIDEDDYEVE
jgi:hypothetical protein